MYFQLQRTYVRFDFVTALASLSVEIAGKVFVLGHVCLLCVCYHCSSAGKQSQMSLRNYTVSQKNAPTLASCSFDKHGLILIIFGKQHQQTFKNYTLIQLSLSLHFYLLYLLLNGCDGNDAFWRHCVLVAPSSSSSRKRRILSLQICV